MPSKTYAYTGEWQRFNVPKDVKWVTISLDGAGSGGREGGRVTGRLKVTDKQTLFILVGGKGNAPTGSTGGVGAVGGGGAGGSGRGGKSGGYGGGGASVIRLNSATGIVKAVAAGAGGNSGDGGKGGAGGTKIGENGWPAAGYPGEEEVDTGDQTYPDYDTVGNSTGGTQVQGGNGGTSNAGSIYNGKNATNAILARGGKGGGGILGIQSGQWQLATALGVYGGGGGGGGYRAGGGGQAGLPEEIPGGGGGGGSNFIGTLAQWTTARGDGGTGHGRVVLSWVTPPPANQPPNAPSEAQVNGKAEADAMATGSTGSVKVSAKLTDPDSQNRVRLVVRYSTDPTFAKQVKVESSALIYQERPKTADHPASNGRATVTLSGLSQNTRYFARLYARDAKGLLSVNYNSVNFWTNRSPLSPTLVTPAENATISELVSVQFQWTHRDPDPASSQSRFDVQWRRAATPLVRAGAWVSHTAKSSSNVYVANPGTFVANRFYEWRVRTADQQGNWGPFALARSFFISGVSTPPILLDPTRDEAVDVLGPVTFKWRFRDPNEGDSQTEADLRYRAVDSESEDWFTILGTTTTPGTDQFWTLPEDTFIPGVNYEWQVRTTDALNSAVSGWSDSATFWAVATPGIGGVPTLLPAVVTEPLGALGIGVNRVFVYDRGGLVRRGELTPLRTLSYGRRRDDISNCVIDTNGFDAEGREFLASLRSWMHELVVFRNGERVWEGPITRITYGVDSVEVEAKDVMVYVYRRIMRQGYNDAYRVVNGEQLGLTSVVQRAVRIVMNALAPADPNLLPYLTSLDYPDDAPLSRVAQDFSRTAWEEVDDLAATRGLDYTTVGRRIVFWDTHRPLGRLPELRDENFSSPPVVTEYGMLTATSFGVTNNNGVWALATKAGPKGPLGMVELLASAFGEAEGEPGITPTDSQSMMELEKALKEQAERNIAGRYPTPLVVRVPDNSTIHPESPVGFNQLVPGVWLPIRARKTPREVAQWQKLDVVNVEQDANGERVMVTMSPAPNAGQDPDAEPETEVV